MDKSDGSFPPQSPAFFLKPLMISLAVMVGTCAAILAYHLLVVKYCLGGRRRRVTLQALARQSLAVSIPDGSSNVGVEEKILKMIPVLEYSSGKGNPGFWIDQRECAVCLGELEDGEAVRLLPSCRHAFHVPCIDQWFLAHSSCPVCRSPVNAATVDDVRNDKPVPSLLPGNTSPASMSFEERLSSAGTLRHCTSLVIMPTETTGIPGSREAGLKRSLSMMDTSHIAINIEQDQADRASATSSLSSPSSSSSSQGDLSRSSDSFRRFDHMSMSSRLLRSFSQLRIVKAGCRNESDGSYN